MSLTPPPRKKHVTGWKTYMEDIQDLSPRGKTSLVISVLGLIVLGYGASIALHPTTPDIAGGLAIVATGAALYSVASTTMKDDHWSYLWIECFAAFGALCVLVITFAPTRNEYASAVVTILLFFASILGEALYLQRESKAVRKRQAEADEKARRSAPARARFVATLVAGAIGAVGMAVGLIRPPTTRR
ncbi:hypothetical protein [Clavibacter sp. VKM Ac-2542]|uniref:hypothetical protein n=1 Tax=Clavibacter sp. VKM Ac-2542 TaxID=2783811 RepID=UPI00188C0E1B|nr:hypothetical protein [Clavibacter sp. VKM Ac-2542]MBF4622623.1 hypothetical protein [Clavibacter sp. VKM Ac-2542]